MTVLLRVAHATALLASLAAAIALAYAASAWWHDAREHPGGGHGPGGGAVALAAGALAASAGVAFGLRRVSGPR